MYEIIKETIDWIDKVINKAVIKLILPIILNGFLFYFIQRKSKRNDQFIIEKNKKLVAKFIECESEIFDLMNSVKTLSLTPAAKVLLSEKIKNLTMVNNLYICDQIIKISNDFSDYLLETSLDPSIIDMKKENKFLKNFKEEFKK